MRGQLALSAVVLAAVVATGALAGCSGSSATHSATTSSRSGGTSTPAGPSGSSGAGSSAGPSSTPGQTGAGPTSNGTTGGPTSSSAASSGTAPAKPIATQLVQGVNGASYQVDIWAFASDKDCAAHAHGDAVVAFLTQHPCAGMRRLLATTSLNDRKVAFAAEAVDLPGGTTDRPFATSADFQDLISTPADGGPNDLLRDGKRIPGGPTALPGDAVFSYGGQDSAVYTLHGWYLGAATGSDAGPLTQLLSDVSVLLTHTSF